MIAMIATLVNNYVKSKFVCLPLCFANLIYELSSEGLDIQWVCPEEGCNDCDVAIWRNNEEK